MGAGPHGEASSDASHCPAGAVTKAPPLVHHMKVTMAADQHDTVTSDAADGARSVTTDDPIGLVRELEASGRFVRDNGLGRILHPGKGKISFRQAVREDSLHIIIDGDHVFAHIDRLSPLAFDKDGNAYYSLPRAVRYSLRRILAHNLATMADAIWSLMSPHHRDHRRKLSCERVNPDDAATDPPIADERP